MTKRELTKLYCDLMRSGLDSRTAGELARIAESYGHSVSVEVK